MFAYIHNILMPLPCICMCLCVMEWQWCVNKYQFPFKSHWIFEIVNYFVLPHITILTTNADISDIVANLIFEQPEIIMSCSIIHMFPLPLPDSCFGLYAIFKWFVVQLIGRLSINWLISMKTSGFVLNWVLHGFCNIFNCSDCAGSIFLLSVWSTHQSS